jgi:hypothetical protein
MTTPPKITIPNILSNEREERIAARRARVAHRLEQRKGLKSPGSSSFLSLPILFENTSSLLTHPLFFSHL